MTDRLKSVFDAVHAEDNLKDNTVRFLHSELQKRGKTRRRAISGKFAAALACAAILLLSGTAVYITPAAYVDVDVNPSTRLTLNGFDRVIGAYAYNGDGSDIIDGLSVKHKSYDDALALLMDTIAVRGYLQNGGLVSVTLQTDDKARENKLLTGIQTGIEEYMTAHHQTAQIEVFPVSADVRGDSYAQDVTPAKYLAILELIEVDPSASMENCRGHSISEIKRLAQEHGGYHGGSVEPESGDNGRHEETERADSGASGQGGGKHEENETAQTPAQSGGHHGEGKSNRHRGHD